MPSDAEILPPPHLPWTVAEEPGLRPGSRALLYAAAQAISEIYTPSMFEGFKNVGADGAACVQVSAYLLEQFESSRILKGWTNSLGVQWAQCQTNIPDSPLSGQIVLRVYPYDHRDWSLMVDGASYLYHISDYEKVPVVIGRKPFISRVMQERYAASMNDRSLQVKYYWL